MLSCSLLVDKRQSAAAGLCTNGARPRRCGGCESRFPDHHRYNAEDLRRVLHRRSRRKQLLCTEKDAAKLLLLAEAMQVETPILILEIAIGFVDNDEELLKEWLGNRLEQANGSLHPQTPPALA